MSESFLRRHPEYAHLVEFYSTDVGRKLNARRRALKALPLAELFNHPELKRMTLTMQGQEHSPHSFRKPTLIEKIVGWEFPCAALYAP